MNPKKLDNLRVYVYVFLFAVVLLPILFGKEISTQMNQLIVVATIFSLIAVATVEGMRYAQRRSKK